MLVISIWLISMMASILLFKRVAGSLSPFKPNIQNIVFYYSFFLSSSIGALLIGLGIDHHYMINRLDHEEVRIIGFYLVMGTLVGYPLIAYLINYLVSFDAEVELKTYLYKEVALSKKKNEKLFLLVFIAASFVATLAIAYTFRFTSVIPLYELLKGNTSDLAKMRIDAGRSFNGNVYIRNIFGIALTPMLSIIAYIYFLRKKNVLWTVLFFWLLGLSVLISTYDLAKSPIIFYGIMLLLTQIYVNPTSLNLKKATSYGLVAVGLLVAMYVFVQGVTSVEQFASYNKGPIGRIILTQIAPFFLHLDVFGPSESFIGWRGLPSFIVNFFEIEQVRSARILMENVFPENIDKGTGGVLNTLFIAEAYASFNYLGILISVIYVSVVVQILYIFFLRLPKSPEILALFIYFTINIPRTIVGGVADFLFNPIWVFLSLSMLGFLVVERYFTTLYEGLKNFRWRRRHL